MECKCGRMPGRLGTALLQPIAWASGYSWGEGGTGKSHRAVQMIGGTPGARWLSLPRYVQEERAAAMEKPEERYDLERKHEKLRGARALVIDDLGAERYTELAGEAVYLLLDERWATGGATIVTSNLAPAQLAEVHGDRIASRCAGLGPTIHLRGGDRRTGASMVPQGPVTEEWRGDHGWIVPRRPGDEAGRTLEREEWKPITRGEIDQIYRDFGLEPPARAMVDRGVAVPSLQDVEARRAKLRDQAARIAEEEVGSGAEPLMPTAEQAERIRELERGPQAPAEPQVTVRPGLFRVPLANAQGNERVTDADSGHPGFVYRGEGDRLTVAARDRPDADVIGNIVRRLSDGTVLVELSTEALAKIGWERPVAPR